ncbi:MAG: hypothetical protein BWX84_00714 [Verrucomicrobia bacterium ADurb.Bin118]|nr:MAG: hypothetical protein BWX84_00714 [Verrucomicrobia bacterium ADurb.Bin118]
MQGPQDGRHVAAFAEQGEKRLRDVRVVAKRAIHEEKLIAHKLGQVGMQMEPALLRIEKHAHQAARIILEHLRSQGVNLSLLKPETIFRLLRGAAAPGPQHPLCLAMGRRGRQQRQALLQHAGDEENVARLRIELAHEAFDAAPRRAIGKPEMMRHGGLKGFGQHIHGTVGVVMQLRAHAQEEIVGGFELFALGRGDERPRLQIPQSPGAVFEKGHPNEVLKITQRAAAALEIRLLHAGRITEPRPAGGLIGQAGGDVFTLVSDHAPGHQRALKFFEQPRVPGNQPRLDQRGFGLHVNIGNLHAIVHRSYRVADPQPEIPQGIQNPVNDPGQMRGRLMISHHLARVQ